MGTLSQNKLGFRKNMWGWIPGDWNLKKLKELTSKIGDGIHTTPVYIKESEYYFINGNNLVNGKIVITKGTKCVSLNEYHKFRKELTDKTILISINGTIGNIALYNNERVILGKSAAYINCNTNIHKSYLYYLLQTNRINRYFENELTGSTIRNLSLASIRETPIPVPPIPEQQKIAKILSIWDNAIRKTEQLIQEKTILKKGIMQQLLTSQRRFKEFEGEEWINFIFGHLGEFYNGLTGKNKEDFGSGYPYIPFLNIINNSRINPEQMDYIMIKPDEKQNKVKYGDIFFTTSSETPEEAGMPSVLLDNLDTTYLNSFCFGFRPKDFLTMNPDFARFYFRSKGVRKEIFKLAQGSTRYNISKSEIMKLKIRLPSVDEQYKIASFLSNIEDELNILNNTMIKFKDQKKGLMQKLLTGEIRVKTVNIN